MIMGIWALAMIGVGIWASKRGRSIIVWLPLAAIIVLNYLCRGHAVMLYPLIALFLWPLVSFILLRFLPDLNGKAYTHIICGTCAEYIKSQAKICKHCGTSQVKLTVVETDEPTLPSFTCNS
jgi:hypothetical protein